MFICMFHPLIFTKLLFISIKQNPYLFASIYDVFTKYFSYSLKIESYLSVLIFSCQRTNANFFIACITTTLIKVFWVIIKKEHDFFNSCSFHRLYFCLCVPRPIFNCNSGAGNLNFLYIFPSIHLIHNMQVLYRTTIKRFKKYNIIIDQY